jgi:predicted ester cyclase
MVDGNVDTLERLEDSNVIYHMPGGKDRLGHEAHKRDILILRPAISGLKLDMRYLAGEGNVFALSLKSSGRYVNEIPTRPLPIGKHFSDDYLFFYRLNNNRIAEVWINGITTITE